jgi:hypothetical protein
MAFQCPICPKAFASRAALKKHTGTKYQNAQPHKCYKCDKVFCSKLAMENHREAPSHLTMFGCDVCDRKFGAKHAVAQHKKSPPHIRKVQAKLSAPVTGAVGYFVDLTPTPVDVSWRPRTTQTQLLRPLTLLIALVTRVPCFYIFRSGCRPCI